MNPIETAIAPLLGIPSWRAVNSHGSMFLIDFGEPRVEIGEARPGSTGVRGTVPYARRRYAFASGRWTLCIELCEWSLDVDGWLLAHSESTRTTIVRALQVVQGQAISSLAIEPASGATVIAFDLGATLRTKATEPDADQGESDDEPVTQWWLACADGRHLSVRDDATYSITPGNLAGEDADWIPLPT